MQQDKDILPQKQPHCCPCILASAYWSARPRARCCSVCCGCCACTTVVLFLVLLLAGVGISTSGDCLNRDRAARIVGASSNGSLVVNGWNPEAGSEERRDEAEAHFGVAVARNDSLFQENAWTPFEYPTLNKNLYITGFRTERRTAYNLAVQVFLLTLLPPIVWRTYTSSYDEFFGSSEAVADPVGGYVDARRRFVDNGASFGGLFAGELVLQTFVEGSVERSAGEVQRARFDYTFDGAIRGKVRVSLDTEPNDCFDLGA